MPKSVSWLIVISSAPYFQPSAAAGIDAALACGAFGQTVSVVLEGAGRALLNPDQHAPAGQRNLFRQLCALPLYDIDRISIVSPEWTPAAAARASTIAATDCESLHIDTISPADLAQLAQQATHVLNF